MVQNEYGLQQSNILKTEVAVASGADDDDLIHQTILARKAIGIVRPLPAAKKKSNDLVNVQKKSISPARPLPRQFREYRSILDARSSTKASALTSLQSKNPR